MDSLVYNTAAAAGTEIRRRRRCRHVSHDIISEILLRLPVKSLLRFRCASKTWLFLISDPWFVESHRRRSQRNPLVLIRQQCDKEDGGSSSGGGSSCGGLALSALTDHGTVEKYAALGDVATAKKAIQMSSSSHDLLCVRQGNRYTLLNPATREHAVLPDVIPLARWPDRCYLTDPFDLCFGYVPAIGRFKAAVFYDCIPLEDPAARHTCFDVLTLGVDRSWRPAADPPFFLHSKPPVVVRGVLHCLPFPVSADKGIAALDLETEAWSVIPLPTSGVSSTKHYWNLCQIRESLFLSLCSRDVKLELWELKGSCGAGNWAKEYSIDISAYPSIVDRCVSCSFLPVVMSGDGKVLVKAIQWLPALDSWYERAAAAAAADDTGDYSRYIWCDWYDVQGQKFMGVGFAGSEANFQPCAYAENYLPLNSKF